MRCGGVAFGRRSAAAAAYALCAVRVVGESPRPSRRSLSRCSRGAAARGAARALLVPAVPPHLMRRCCARPPLLCSGASHSLRGVRHRQWRSALPEAFGNRRTLQGGCHRAALTASLHVTPLVSSSRPPCCCMHCGGVAYGSRSAAAAAHALYAVRVVVSGSARSLRAAAGESSRPSGRSPSHCSSGAAARGATRALLAFAVLPRPMRRRCARPPLLCGGGSRSLRSARHRQWRRTLSAGGHRRAVTFFGAVAVALHSRRRCALRRSCASRACRAAASDAAVLCSAAAPLWRRLALSAKCASSSSDAFSLRAAVGDSSRSSGRSPSCRFHGAAARGAARALPAPVVPPRLMRRCCARPPLLCDGGLRSLRSALVFFRGLRSQQAAVGKLPRTL